MLVASPLCEGSITPYHFAPLKVIYGFFFFLFLFLGGGGEELVGQKWVNT